MIETKDLTKLYDSCHGINSITLTVKDGSSIGLLGRNGAGKTTFVRTLIGLLKPDSGEATIDGFDTVSDSYAIRRIIGYLPESFGLYSAMTVYEILDYAGKLHRIEKSERHERIKSLLEKLELFDIKNMKAGTLSKGLTQKVGFARAILNDPKIIFLDEPTSGLDPVASRKIEKLMAELKNDGKTLIITTHILSQAEKMCDSVALIKEGRLLAFEGLSEIKKKYSQPAVMIRLFDKKSAQQALALLKSMFRERIEISDNQLIIRTSDADRLSPLINKELVGANIAVLEITRNDATLDEVFFKALEA